jgi:hypothetical protein
MMGQDPSLYQPLMMGQDPSLYQPPMMGQLPINAEAQPEDNYLE